jgi:hypothetical protein
MDGRDFGRWIVTTASVILPLAAVIYSLQYQSVVGALVGLALAATIAIVLAEISARIDAGPLAQSRRPAADADTHVVPLRRRSGS